jgi:5-dehydro-4-deoxyglucarate dehydratase
MDLPPRELASRLEGLLAFPLTPFTGEGRVNQELLRRQVDGLLGRGAVAVCPACGTGEFFSLSPVEYEQVLEACSAEVGGRVPIVAGIGYGTALACTYAEIAGRAGADAVLVMPPYLAQGGVEGMEAHYRAVARSTPLAVILYQRDNAVFDPAMVLRLAEEPNVIGVKDGIGQLERLHQIRRLVGDRLILLNGLPTAEIHAQALSFCGARGYSSAILNFMPEIAIAFHRAYGDGDEVAMRRLLDTAVLPFATIRNRRPGYAVSLVKAGARLRGIPVGPARAPLSEVTAEDERDLLGLLSTLGLDSPLLDAKERTRE